jgi:hypothetical protein
MRGPCREIASTNLHSVFGSCIVASNTFPVDSAEASPSADRERRWEMLPERGSQFALLLKYRSRGDAAASLKQSDAMKEVYRQWPGN